MAVRRAPLSAAHRKLCSNTITAALHISDGLDDYQPNVIIDLYVRKTGREKGLRACVRASASKSFEGVLSTSKLIHEVNAGRRLTSDVYVIEDMCICLGRS